MTALDCHTAPPSASRPARGPCRKRGRVAATRQRVMVNSHPLKEPAWGSARNSGIFLATVRMVSCTTSCDSVWLKPALSERAQSGVPQWIAGYGDRRTPNPPYPAHLQLRGVTGELELWFRVDREGRTWDIWVKQGSGSKELDRLGSAWVEKRWAFGKGQEHHYRVKLRWTLAK